MFEALREIVTIIKDLPAYAIWILAGFLFYKITVVGSIYGVIRLGINRLFDYLSKEKAVVQKLDLDGHFISNESKHRLLGILAAMKQSSGTYLHSSDVDFLVRAIQEKKENDAKRTAERFGGAKP